MVAKLEATILEHIVSFLQPSDMPANTTSTIQYCCIFLSLATLLYILFVKVDGLDELPRFLGQTGDQYRRWRAKVQWLLAGTPDDKRKLLAPLIIERFTGEPAEHYSEVDPTPYRVDRGVEILLNELDAKYGTFSEIELSRQVVQFFRQTEEEEWRNRY